MERYNKLVQRLASSFTDSGLDFAFTGALAVSFYGAPRTTSDVDIMIAIGGNTA
jgi:hypothetical protein